MSEPTRSQIKKAITEGINELRLEMKEYFSNIEERLTIMEEELSKDITTKYGPIKSKFKKGVDNGND